MVTKAVALNEIAGDAELVKSLPVQSIAARSTLRRVTLGYAPSEEAALELVHERFRFGALGWSVMSEAPSVESFEAATKYIRPEDLKDSAGLGPVPDHLKAIAKFVDADFDHIVLTGDGVDQASFIDFFRSELKPRLTDMA